MVISTIPGLPGWISYTRLGSRAIDPACERTVDSCWQWLVFCSAGGTTKGRGSTRYGAGGNLASNTLV